MSLTPCMGQSHSRGNLPYPHPGGSKQVYSALKKTAIYMQTANQTAKLLCSGLSLNRLFSWCREAHGKLPLHTCKQQCMCNIMFGMQMYM